MNSKTKIFSILLVIMLISVGFKLFFIDFSIPINNDNLQFALRSVAHSEGDFSQTAKKGSGWALFISPFYMTTNPDSFLEFSNIVRVLSMSVSAVTIFPMYALARKFFQPKYSVVAAALLAFEPHLNYNASFGFSEPLYILTIILSFYFIINKNEKLSLLSFALAGFVWWIRIEGVIIFFLISIIMVVTYKKSPRLIAKYAACVLIFALVVSPMLFLRYDQFGDPFYFYYNDHFSRFLENEELSNTASANDYFSERGIENFINEFVFTGFSKLAQTLTSLSFPYLIILLPFGIFFSLRAFDQEKNHIRANWIMILGTLAFLIIPFALIADRRFLFSLLPFLIVVGVIPIQRLVEYGLSTFAFSEKQKNLSILIILIIVIVLSAIFIQRFEPIDSEKEHELMRISEYIVKDLDGKTALDFSLDKYLLNTKINENPENFKNFMINPQYDFSEKSIIDNYKSLFIIINEESFSDVMKISRQHQIEYIAVSDDNRSEFLDDVYWNEEKYDMLIKIFDSKDHNFIKINVKIFKILT